MLRAALLDKQGMYPCTFAVVAETRCENTFLSVDIMNGLTSIVVQEIAQGLARFLEAYSVSSCHRKPTLLCALGPPETSSSLEQDQRTLWKLLSRLRRHDVATWPHQVPVDSDDPGWSFCFAGQPLFVFGLSPHYRLRRSRAISTTLTVCFQSLRVFDGISGSTDAGRKAKARIRARLAEYEDAPLISSLGDGQSSTVNKWEQYFPNDDGARSGAHCPIADRTL